MERYPKSHLLFFSNLMDNETASYIGMIIANFAILEQNVWALSPSSHSAKHPSMSSEFHLHAKPAVIKYARQFIN